MLLYYPFNGVVMKHWPLMASLGKVIKYTFYKLSMVKISMISVY